MLGSCDTQYTMAPPPFTNTSHFHYLQPHAFIFICVHNVVIMINPHPKKRGERGERMDTLLLSILFYREKNQDSKKLSHLSETTESD